MLPTAQPLATSQINTMQDPVNRTNTTNLDPSIDTPDWSILTETISYSTPPTVDIRVEVSQSQDNVAPLDDDLPTCAPQTLPTNTHLFQPY